jgi:PilZ domain-containing protein
VTVNVSSGGALLKTDADVPRGTVIEAHVKWPAGLEACDLKLVLTGAVVWKQGSLIGIRRKVHQFRTVSRKRMQKALQFAAAAPAT